MNEQTLKDLEQLFLALSDKTRLKLLGLMGGGEVSVGYLADSLELSQPKISRHLAYLRNCGLVSTRRDGKWIYYAIEPPASPAARHVLAETLGSLSELPRRQSRFDAHEPTVHSHGHFVPNEIEIHLL
ncbi:MAG: metalloregulator ArsR/SmtB family transcription factor [Acidobacteriota bacterium]